MISFKKVRESRAIQIAAACSNSAEFASLVNDASRRLLRRGDWFNTAVPVFVCIYNGCLVWPRYVAQVRKINICNYAIPVHNQWYNFLPANLPANTLNAYCGAETKVVQHGVSPVFQDVMGEGRLIRAYTRCNVDAGKTVTIFGTDNNGQQLMTDNGDGTFSPGIILTLTDGSTFASSTTYVRHIDYIIRDATQCFISLYAYDVANDVLEDIGQYEPTDTEPSFVRQRLTLAPPVCGAAISSTGCCSGRAGVLAMVKLRHIDVAYDNDLLVMDNLDALKMEIMSIKSEESGNFNEKRQWESAAVEVLNRDLEINSPDEEFSASNNTLGPYVRSNRCF